MKYIRLVFGVISGLLVITIVAEAIEFTIVKSVSGKSFEALQANKLEYFTIRNRNWILVSKAFYSLIAGISGGFVTTWISKGKAKIAIYVLLLIQIASLIWGGFISEQSETGPLWMWGYLLIIIPSGIWVGYRWRRRHTLQQGLRNHAE